MKILLVAILSLNWAAEAYRLKRGFESMGFNTTNDLGSLEKAIDLSKGNQITEKYSETCQTFVKERIQIKFC